MTPLCLVDPFGRLVLRCVSRSLGFLLLLSALSFFHVTASASVSAQDFLLGSAYWHDHAGKSTLSEAKQAPYTQYSGVLSEGYRSGASWVRLTVAGVGRQSPLQSLFIRIRPTYLNQVTLFDPALAWHPRFTGDDVVNPDYLVRPTNPGFKVPATEHDRDVYLRLDSTSAHLLDVQVIDPEQFLQDDGFQTFWHGLFFGVTGLILLWAFVEWLARRDALAGRFLVKHIAVTVYCIGYLGYWVYFFSPTTSFFRPDLIFSYSIFILVFVALWFHVGVLTDYGIKGWPLRVCQFFYVIPIASVLLGLTGFIQAGLKAATLTTLVLPCIVFLVALLTPAPHRALYDDGLAGSGSALNFKGYERFGSLSKRTLVIYYGVILLLLGLGATQVLGLLQGNGLVLHVFLFHSVISSLLLMTMLLVRSRDLERRQIRATLDAARAQGELLAERLAREEQSRMVEMIAHEIKTPLSVLQLSVEEWINGTKERRIADKSIEEIRTVVDQSIDGFKELLGPDEFESVDLVDVLCSQIQRSGSDFRFQPDLIKAAPVLGNRLLIERMISNFLDNALKYGDPGKDISVKVRSNNHLKFGHPQAGFELTVVNAIGPAGKPDPASVFKRYYRASAARHLSGTGMGLHLVQTFAYLQQGAVQYRPSESHVEFALWLPASTSW